MTNFNSIIFEITCLIVQNEINDIAAWRQLLFDKILPLLSIETAFLCEYNHRKKSFLTNEYAVVPQHSHLLDIDNLKEAIPNAIIYETLADNPAHSRLKMPFFYQEKLWGGLVIDYQLTNTTYSKDFWSQLYTYLSASLIQVVQKSEQRKYISQLEAINVAMEESQKQIHENAVRFLRIHKQLTDSIQYAQKMQKAILPHEEKIAKSFDDYFIIYLPKDVVSGDFYWFSQIDLTFLAVIDCTGHGVPGAFMSMIGNTLLNEIVNTKRVYDPAKILFMLNQGVQEALKQSESNNMDGMDVCLCRFELQPDFKLKLTYAGAKRPLYYVRNGQINKLLGDRHSIGGGSQANKQPKKFNNQVLFLEEGDALFLTTDGFNDTPNEQRESFGKNRFKNILTENGHLSMPELKAVLLQTLKEHQKDTLQRDDITVIGIRI